MSGEILGFLIVPALLFVAGRLLFYIDDSPRKIILSKIIGALILLPFIMTVQFSRSFKPNAHENSVVIVYGLFIFSGLISNFSQRIGAISIAVPYTLILYFYLTR
jgi:hypothetical protein